MAKIKVQNTEVTVITYNDKDYIYNFFVFFPSDERL